MSSPFCVPAGSDNSSEEQLRSTASAGVHAPSPARPRLDGLLLRRSSTAYLPASVLPLAALAPDVRSPRRRIHRAASAGSRVAACRSVRTRRTLLCHRDRSSAPAFESARFPPPPPIVGNRSVLDTSPSTSAQVVSAPGWDSAGSTCVAVRTPLNRTDVAAEAAPFGAAESILRQAGRCHRQTGLARLWEVSRQLTH